MSRAMDRTERAAWFALAMNAAAYLEEASVSHQDPDAKASALGAAKHVREGSNVLWTKHNPKAPIDSIWMFKSLDGRWMHFIDERHKQLTIESGAWEVREFFAGPIHAPVGTWEPLLPACLDALEAELPRSWVWIIGGAFPPVLAKWNPHQENGHPRFYLGENDWVEPIHVSHVMLIAPPALPAP